MRKARVAIGLPVFNGERFLAEAIESILAQSYGDFRLLISDNFSTDATQDICRQYLKLDNRIEYYRQTTNIGGARNFNFVFRPSGADYFKWSAHDDLLEPNFIQETVSLLDANCDAVVAHGRSLEIDESGRITGDFNLNPSLGGVSPSQRLWSVMWSEYFTEVFGLMRSNAVARTQLYGSYPGSDRNFMAEIVMLGDVVYSGEVIFRRRAHPGSYVHAMKTANAQQAWFDPSVHLAVPRSATRLYHYWKAIRSAPISNSDRAACQARLARWAWLRLTEDVKQRFAGATRGTLADRVSKRGLITIQEKLMLDHAVHNPRIDGVGREENWGA